MGRNITNQPRVSTELCTKSEYHRTTLEVYAQESDRRILLSHEGRVSGSDFVILRKYQGIQIGIRKFDDSEFSDHLIFFATTLFRVDILLGKTLRRFLTMKPIDVVCALFLNGIAIVLMLSSISCRSSQSFVCHDTSFSVSNVWPPELTFADSMVVERDLVLAVGFCEGPASVFCCNRDVTDPPLECHVIEFDTSCWSIWKSYETGLFASESGSEFDGLKNSQIDTLLIGDHVYTNIIHIRDEQFASLRIDFNYFSYKLYRARIKYIRYGKYSATVYNFGRKYGDCTLVYFPANYLQIVSFMSVQPYFVDDKISRFCD